MTNAGKPMPEDNPSNQMQVAFDNVLSAMVMISLPDLGEEKLSLSDVVEMAKRFNQVAGMEFLARLNLWLSLAQLSADSIVRVETQKEVIRRVSSPARLEQLTSAFGALGLYDKYILLHRAQLLVGIKLIAIYGSQEGGNRLEREQ